MKRFVRTTAAVLAASVVFAIPAQAQTFFSGYTNACFYLSVGAACVPELNSANVTDTFGPLTYRNSTFSGTTSFGFLGIGSLASSTVNVDNLGSFLLTAGTQNFVGQSFVLRVSFTAPAGVMPPSALHTAILVGNVSPNVGNAGGLSLIFTNPTQDFVYDGGTFQLRVNDLSLTGVGLGMPDKLVAMTGQIIATPSALVPEPSTYVLMASALAGLGVVYRRKVGSQ